MHNALVQEISDFRFAVCMRIFAPFLQTVKMNGIPVTNACQPTKEQQIQIHGDFQIFVGYGEISRHFVNFRQQMQSWLFISWITKEKVDCMGIAPRGMKWVVKTVGEA